MCNNTTKLCESFRKGGDGKVGRVIEVGSLGLVGDREEVVVRGVGVREEKE
jgi:hypothetical protein